MGFFSWLKATFTPQRVLSSAQIVRERPLHEQFQRIGGGLTPLDVSSILRSADGGQPQRLIDLWNESRQKDGHLQSVCGTRETAVSLVDLDFIEPEDAAPKEQEAALLCRRVRDDFRNWPTLIEHLAGSFVPGHATAELIWEKLADGTLAPTSAVPIHARDFIFARDTGTLRYRQAQGDLIGTDLLADNPGRIIQIQRRIVGDVPAREGLMRVLVWAALFRNWTLRDWIALGEIGWKPWRIGKYQPGTHQKDVDALTDALERIGATGVAVIPSTTELDIQWPEGGGAGRMSTHRELFDTIGREMSKATIGVTTSTEPGPNGDRASTETRDKVRTDIREADCRAIAAALRHHLFIPLVAINFGPDVRCPVPWFQTEESADQKEFSEAVKNLVEAGLDVPAKWVRDEIGMPEPLEGEETLAASFQVPGDAEDDQDIPGDVEEDEPTDDEKRIKATPSPGDNGREYIDRLEQSGMEAGARELALTVAGLVAAVEKAGSYHEARQAILEKYRNLEPPRNLAELTEAALTLAQAAGQLAVLEETPEIQQ